VTNELDEPNARPRLLRTTPMTLGRLVGLVLGGLALAATTIVAVSAYALLREQADDQALDRVRLAGFSARDEIRRISEDTLTAARLLASRPTLTRLVREGQPAPLEQFVGRFCETGGYGGCAVLAGPVIIAQTGQAMPWTSLVERSGEQGERFMAAPPQAANGLLGAIGEVPAMPGTRVVIVRTFDPAFVEELRQHTGEDVRILRLTNWIDNVDPALRPLHSAVLSGSDRTAQLVRSLGIYAASVPIFAPTGEGVALIEVRLPAERIETALAHFLRRLAWTALIVGAVAVVLGIVLGRSMARPVRALTRAARRLGQGDFSTSIPAGGSAETTTLANTMEDMRRSLVELTAALRRREAEAQALLQGVVEGVVAVDNARNIRYMNPQAARMLGIDAPSAIARFCGDVLNPALVDGVRPCEQLCPIVAARGSGQARATEFLRRSDGAKRTVVITSAGPVDGLQVQVMRDETELEAVRRARDTVLANISHEFRTPLAAQLASIELLQDGLPVMSREQVAELVASLQRGTLRLTWLIDNLLESVRIEAGQLAIRRQPVSLPQVVEDAAELVAGLRSQRQQVLDVDLPDDLPQVLGDVGRLTQVFVNLLANAIKFGPERGTIRVGAARSDGQVETWIEDEGPGVPELERNTIFERFHRSGEEEPEPGGLGLGLWIVRSIVERHGGHIGVTRPDDARTRFTLTLPVAPEAAA
jgi:signal transduction histidine kinase/HAMP domain-containing protein